MKINVTAQTTGIDHVKRATMGSPKMYISVLISTKNRKKIEDVKMFSFDKNEENFFIKSHPFIFSENGCGNEGINKIPDNSYKNRINKIGYNKPERILTLFLLYGEHYGRNYEKQSYSERDIACP